jgi:hypothetical protein
MRFTTLRPILCLFVAAISACATTQTTTDHQPEADQDNGVIVFSVTHDLDGGRGEKLVILRHELPWRKRGVTYQSGEVNFLGMVRDDDFTEVHGYLYAVSVPAGKYSFSDWTIETPGGSIFSKHTVPLDFTVNPREVVYLGAFHGHFLKRDKNFFGMNVTVDGVASIRDARERDVALLLKRYPRYEGKIQYRILPQGIWRAGRTGSLVYITPPTKFVIPEMQQATSGKKAPDTVQNNVAIPHTKEERLADLKRLYNSNVISKEVYLERQKAIIDAPE